MSIVLFSEITTEKYLAELEDQSKKYHEGLYADMSDAPQRKHVKDSAAHINDLLKKLDRARIDKKKEYSAKVEKEAGAIRIRLEKANSPFTKLIDEWNDKRAEILAEEKRAREAKELAGQIEKDHDYALLLDAQMVAERMQREKEKAEHEQKLKDDAAAKAVEDHKLEIEREEKRRINEENARLANREHLANINNGVAYQLKLIGLSEEQAKNVVIAIAKGDINNVSIKY